MAPTNSIQDAIDFMNLFYPKLGNTKDDTLLKFKKEHLLCCWTRKCHCIDATVIELNDEGKKYFRDELKITFLKIADANVNDLVAILQMPEGKSKFAYGNIKAVNESQVSYQIATAPGSSGAPVLNQNCMAVAVHRAANSKFAVDNKPLTDQPDVPRKASLLRDVVNAFFNEANMMYVVCIFDLLNLRIQICFIRAQNQNYFKGTFTFLTNWPYSYVKPNVNSIFNKYSCTPVLVC